MPQLASASSVFPALYETNYNRTAALHCEINESNLQIICLFVMGWITFEMTLQMTYCKNIPEVRLRKI